MSLVHFHKYYMVLHSNDFFLMPVHQSNCFEFSSRCENLSRIYWFRFKQMWGRQDEGVLYQPTVVLDNRIPVKAKKENILRCPTISKLRRSVGPDLLLNWGRRLQKHQMFSFQFFCRMLLTVQFTQQHFSEESDWTLFCACSMEGMWPAEWTSEGTRLLKRNMVVADDAAFREKSKLLTAMERQKWLNSYMQKLLVVNS